MGEAEEVKKRKRMVSRSAGRGLVRAKEIVVIGLGQTIGRTSKFKRCCVNFDSSYIFFKN